MKNILFFLIVLFAGVIGFGQVFSENFDDISELESRGWVMTNLSQPLGQTNWFQGNPAEFPAHNGASNSYIAANYNNTSGAGTICNWLITPTVYVRDGDKLSFWTRTANNSIFNDRLEIRMSQGTMTIPSSVSNVGSFTNIMTIINDDYNLNYPLFWDQYILTVSGVGNTLVPVNFAFRYYVTNAGPSGANGNYIGIDEVTVTNYGIYTISTFSTPEIGGTTSGGGTYYQGNTATVNAIANEGFSFINWQENGTVVSMSQNYSFTVNGDRNLVAKFKRTNTGDTYTVTTKSTPTAGGITTGDGTYAFGALVSVKATPNDGYSFVNWTINNIEVSTTKTYKFNIVTNTKLTSNYVKKEFEVITKSIPTVGGTTSGDGMYLYKTKATVKAIPNTGYTFVNWTDTDGNILSVNKTYKFNVLKKTKVFANFAPKNYLLTTVSNPTIGGTTTGDGIYPYNSKVSVSASPNEGYSFVNWTLNGVEVSSKNNFKYKIIGKAKLVANFALTNSQREYKKEIQPDIFSYYPNPVKDILYIKTNHNIQNLKVFNLSGQEIMNLDTKSINNRIDVRFLPKGIYLFSTTFENGEIKTFKIIRN